jgi:hypothetical protein
MKKSTEKEWDFFMLDIDDFSTGLARKLEKEARKRDGNYLNYTEVIAIIKRYLRKQL